MECTLFISSHETDCVDIIGDGVHIVHIITYDGVHIVHIITCDGLHIVHIIACDGAHCSYHH